MHTALGPRRGLNLDIMMMVFEYLDLDTIRRLDTMPEYSPTLRYYHKSLLRGFHQRREIPAGGPGMSKAVLAYEYIYGHPDDPSTREPVGAICPVTETASLAAVERRERMVETLLQSPFLRINPRPCGMHNTWPRLGGGRARGIFRDIIRRALYQCDAIQDFEAQAVIDLGIPVSAYLYAPTAYGQSCNIPKRRPSFREVILGPETGGQAIDGSTVEGQRYLYQVVVPNRARVLQAPYIRSLSTDDLLGLFMLNVVALVSWQESRTGVFIHLQNHPVEDQPVEDEFVEDDSVEDDSVEDQPIEDPIEDQPIEDQPIENAPNNDLPLEVQYQLVAFQENILRRGTCFLYCDRRGYGEKATHRRQMLDDAEEVHNELNGNLQLEPLLITTLENELTGRLGVTRDELVKTVEDEVAERIGVEGAFAMHPFDQPHGLDPGYWPAPEDL